MDPALRQAAVLLTHWNRCDVEAVTLLLAGLDDVDEARDMILALLILRNKTDLTRFMVPA